jgi:hypothetical protein
LTGNDLTEQGCHGILKNNLYKQWVAGMARQPAGSGNCLIHRLILMLSGALAGVKVSDYQLKWCGAINI